MEHITLKNKTLWGTIDKLVELEDCSLNEMTMYGVHYIIKNMFCDILENAENCNQTLINKFTKEVYVKIDKQFSLTNENDTIIDNSDTITVKKTYRFTDKIKKCLIITITKKLYI